MTASAFQFLRRVGQGWNNLDKGERGREIESGGQKVDKSAVGRGRNEEKLIHIYQVLNAR